MSSRGAAAIAIASEPSIELIMSGSSDGNCSRRRELVPPLVNRSPRNGATCSLKEPGCVNTLCEPQKPMALVRVNVACSWSGLG